MILVDTSVLIDFFKGRDNEPSRKFREVLQKEIPFGITSAIYQEVLQGVGSEREFRILKRYLDTQRFFHPKDPIESYSSAAKIFIDCRKKGVTVRSTIDCLIAQIAMEYDLAVLHNDEDFDAIARVSNLKIY